MLQLYSTVTKHNPATLNNLCKPKLTNTRNKSTLRLQCRPFITLCLTMLFFVQERFQPYAMCKRKRNVKNNNSLQCF